MINFALRELRKKAKLTQQQVASSLGVKHAYYNQMENGKAVITEDRLAKIAEILSLSVEDIKSYQVKELTSDTNESEKIQQLEAEIEKLKANNKELKENLKAFSSYKMSFLELNDGYPVEEVREIAYENETTLLGNNFYTLINLYFGSILENYRDGLLISFYFSSICEELFNELMSKAHTKKTSNSWQNLTSEKKKEMMTDVYRKNLKQMLNRFKERYPYSLFEELGLLDRKDLIEKFKLVYPEDIFVEKLIKILDLFIIKVKVGVGF